jgi:c-di-GMP-binding flagellar brake protein YcgR
MPYGPFSGDAGTTRPRGEVLPRWDDYLDRGLPGGVLWLLLGLLIGTLLYRWIVRRLEAERAAAARWDRMRRISAERGLTPAETNMLAEAITQARPATPDGPLLAPAYFDALVLPELNRRRGYPVVHQIREKLFPERTAETGPAEVRTDRMKVGQRMQLQAPDVPGTLSGVVLGVTGRDFILTFPRMTEREMPLREKQRVSGLIPMENALHGFHTEVVEVFGGEVPAARLSHPAGVQELHRREAVRVSLSQELLFTHIVIPEDVGSEITLAEIEEQVGARIEGRLRDLSTDGCAIQTQAGRHFGIGSFVQFRLQLKGWARERQVLGEVVATTPASARQGGGTILHVQFLALDEETESAIAMALFREGGNELSTDA